MCSTSAVILKISTEIVLDVFWTSYAQFKSCAKRIKDCVSSRDFSFLLGVILVILPQTRHQGWFEIYFQSYSTLQVSSIKVHVVWPSAVHLASFWMFQQYILRKIIHNVCISKHGWFQLTGIFAEEKKESLINFLGFSWIFAVSQQKVVVTNA